MFDCHDAVDHSLLGSLNFTHSHGFAKLHVIIVDFIITNIVVVIVIDVPFQMLGCKPSASEYSEKLFKATLFN